MKRVIVIVIVYTPLENEIQTYLFPIVKFMKIDFGPLPPPGKHNYPLWPPGKNRIRACKCFILCHSTYQFQKTLLLSDEPYNVRYFVKCLIKTFVDSTVVLPRTCINRKGGVSRQYKKKQLLTYDLEWSTTIAFHSTLFVLFLLSNIQICLSHL